MKILSFIIPSYNSEQYLEKCLKSVINDEVIEKLDIIIVNDGSVDNTAVIAQKYCDMFPDSIRLVSQENKGHGGAINTGFTLANGKYSKVIDADDWVETNNLPELVRKLETIESDVVLTHNYTTDVSNGEVKKWMCYPQKFGVAYTLEDVVSEWNLFVRCFTFHGITYNTEFYRKNIYLLSEKVFYEDHEHSTFPACFARSVTPVDLFVYNYRIGDVQQSVSDASRSARADNMVTVLNRFISEYKGLGDNESIKEFVCLKCKILLVSYLTTMLLVVSDKKMGKARAKKIMKHFKTEMPRTHQLALKQYRLFCIFNFFGIKKRALDKMLSSKLYLKVKGAKSFE